MYKIWIAPYITCRRLYGPDNEHGLKRDYGSRCIFINGEIIENVDFDDPRTNTQWVKDVLESMHINTDSVPDCDLFS